jgi:DNA-binding CsgD family transcriptional regulator
MESNATARLTEREKECLRRWLDHQTAKEIALDLGISPHAVEKRLKMARTKLGLSSSLQAARLLAEVEGYQQPGPQPSELAATPANAEKHRHLHIAMGVLIMLALIGAAALMLQSAPLEVAEAGPKPDAGEALRPGNVRPTTPEIFNIVVTTFKHVDADGSGFLEGKESPITVRPGPQPVYRRDEQGNVLATGETVEVSPERVIADFYAQADKDGDHRISSQEFYNWQAPRLARQCIPARWKEDMNRPISPGG